MSLANALLLKAAEEQAVARALNDPQVKAARTTEDAVRLAASLAARSAMATILRVVTEMAGAA